MKENLPVETIPTSLNTPFIIVEITLRLITTVERWQKCKAQVPATNHSFTQRVYQPKRYSQRLKTGAKEEPYSHWRREIHDFSLNVLTGSGFT